MNRFIACLGFISYLVLGALAKETVEVSRDITVKATPDPLINMDDKVDIVLNCTGSRTDLSYYIKNSLQWSVTNQDGITALLTNSFYGVPQKLFELDSPKRHYSLYYTGREPQNGHTFTLTVYRVTRADDGIYRCTLLNETGGVIDSKEVKVTVVNPVQTVSIELHDAKHKVIGQSVSPINQNSKPVQITPGKYMVKCDASGSNPEPVMNLFLNDQKPYVSLTTKEDMSSEFKAYTGSFEVKSLTINAHNSPQSLVCQSNIPGEYFDSVQAGIALMVTIDKPTIMCENATAAEGDRHSEIKCKVSAKGNNAALVCDNISWLLGTKQQKIEYDQRWKDPSKQYDIIESKCEKTTEGLLVTLDFYTVQPDLFKETFFLVYGKDVNAHRHPVMLYDVTTAAAGIATPLSLLACLVMVVISKHLARL